MNIQIPQVELQTTHYRRDGSFDVIETDLSEIEQHAMDMCRDLGEQALHEGNPPIGAVLIDHDSGQLWGAKTIDKSNPRLLAHAEVRAYNLAQETLGDQLQRSTLVSSAQLCNTCISPYAEGKIGKIVYAAPRWAVFAVAGIMRPRTINMHDLLADGDIDTVVTEGYRAADVLGTFTLWAALRDQGKVRA